MTLLAWQTAGPADGPAVVLLHGWASDARRDWADTGWAAAMGAAGLRVLACDLPGHADSADVAPPESREPAAWTASAVLADLERLGVTEAAVAGYSEGCLVASHLAVLAPERIGRLILVGCDDRTAVPDGAAVGTALRDPDAPLWNPAAAEVVARARADRRHNLVALAHWAERMTWPALPRLGSLRTPVLIAVGAQDAERRSRVPALARALHDGHVVTVPGDHRSALSAPQLHAAVIEFLR